MGWKWVIFLIIAGAGQRMLIATGNYTIQVLTNSQDGPYALAMFSSIGTVGMCLGIAVGGTALQNFFKNYLH